MIVVSNQPAIIAREMDFAADRKNTLHGFCSLAIFTIHVIIGVSITVFDLEADLQFNDKSLFRVVAKMWFEKQIFNTILEDEEENEEEEV